MDVREYMFEVSREPIPRSIDLDDEIFLTYIAEGINSAYKIFKHLEHQVYHPAYKNVHKRVQKLLRYGLIEEEILEPRPLHGAKNYRLKTRGLVYYCSHLSGIGDFIHFINVILSHKDDIIFKTFLFPFLERRTIKNATYTLTKLISNYIIECCEITKYYLQLEGEFYGERQVDSVSDLFGGAPINYMYYRLNSCIQSFILRSVVLNEKFEDWDAYVINMGWDPHRWPQKRTHITACLANDKNETQFLLARDKKFMSSIRVTEEKLKIGFTTLTDLT